MNSEIDKPRRVRRKDDRPAEILAAAVELFVERGFANTRTEDIAARAGVSKGTVYLYYPNKEELLKAIIKQMVLPLIEEAQQSALAHEGSQEALLRALIARWWEAYGLTALAGVNKLIVAEAGNFPDLARFYTDSVVEPWKELLGEIILRGVAQGEFRPVADAAVAAHVFFSPFILLTLWMHSLAPCCSGPQMDPQVFVSQAMDLMLHGLRREPG